MTLRVEGVGGGEGGGIGEVQPRPLVSELPCVPAARIMSGWNISSHPNRDPCMNYVSLRRAPSLNTVYVASESKTTTILIRHILVSTVLYSLPSHSLSLKFIFVYQKTS